MTTNEGIRVVCLSINSGLNTGKAGPEHRQGRDQGLQMSACMFLMFGRCVGVVRGGLYMFLCQVIAHVRTYLKCVQMLYTILYTLKSAH